jgi:hypothetical protein
MTEEKLITIINEFITHQVVRVQLGGQWCRLDKFTGRIIDDSHEIICTNGDGWEMTSTVSKIESLRFV